ncbi:cyclic pyranopterin monophosphate synthase MoaC [Pseudoalteromonas rubra]|uniref:Cyclic pyranopterin monophosphate synthase n=1 Tax=Pseudoalteromonas rubra TaxID=43658 RepID=A0A0U3ICR1_9GAMM|nr:cyclic pyranopterin monophosphate synthase MoaC [Pseudoalteromonas rubra]ALU44919.1 cyclic pyranopterin monophosphate synthase accessory protein [Pseudoalteromonas rubra]
MALTHIDSQGHANMVDVTQKQATTRLARAEGVVRMSQSAFDAVIKQQNAKGDVLATARIAGIQGAKRCADLIPLCHPLALTKVSVSFELLPETREIRVLSECKLAGKTGVEMEALTAVSVATLTLFDMCKAQDPLMEIHGIRVLGKSGGKSGDWERE